MDSYKRDGIDEYEICATLDRKTSQICREQDGKHYPLEKAVTGINYPPFHVFCRTTTVPYIKGLTTTRMARDENGRSVETNAQTYEEWLQGQLQSDGYSGIINTKFDIEKAKEGYSEFLNTVPKANRSILEYYANTTEYVSTDKIKSAFGYSPTTDKVYYNTKHPSFNDFDFSVVNTHELAHRIDNLNCKSWENKNFVNAVAKHNIVDKDMIAKVQSYVSSNKTSPFFDDVISALSENRVKVKARHENEYWKNKGAKETEIFANMFSLESYKDTNEIEFISSNFSDIKLEYLKMRGDI